MIPRLRPIAAALVCAAAACLSPARAQTMQPGLWENTSKTTSQNPQIAQAMAEMQKQLASMTPEQRAAIGQMGGQAGAPHFAMNPDGSVTMKLCLTQKMIDDAGGNFLGPQDGNCSHKKSPLLGGTQRFSFTCNKPPASGQGKITFQGGTSYTSTMTMSSSATGQEDIMLLEGKGKWLGASCGNVKPIDLKPPGAQ
ncbi:DUF3617 domain-containing protein [Massilia genomosp. 1]|uniref:DUF3617 family protein n=1 Tax=Massilia genomosp. 1 TaxID=2609280 RepID=A0ABX0MQN7_9BURK|nr:DUF3617 domain-containing protein [Massilia genomosp. 1]NHZ61657.1 DUF3617 family protein [Massilia genomosp. 1]